MTAVYYGLCVLALVGIVWSGWRRWWRDEWSAIKVEKRRLRALAPGPRSVP